MEPPACVAHVTDSGCEVWAPVQDPQAAQGVLAGALGMQPQDVIVNVTLLGGAFGRKSKPDFVAEAALLSRQMGAPVKLQWSREDEIKHGFYHACSAQHLEAAVGEDDLPTAWLHRSAFPSIMATFSADAAGPQDFELGLGAFNTPFDIANYQLEACDAPAHVRIGWLRSVANIHHAFAIGSFADELAHAAGRDPRDYLLDLIGPARILDLYDGGASAYGVDTTVYQYDTGRLRNVVERVAQESGWGGPAADGRARGIAAHYSFVTYVAQVVEASVDDRGRIQVHRVDCAVDCGRAVNPDRVRAQVEGAVVFGLSLALHGDITMRNGAVTQGNFNDYPILRLNEAPEIHVHLVESDVIPTGVGEPGVPPLAPALANAVYAATGTRLRELPLRV
jgi:isoquinoline 1-oxidoreductase beta subunit